MDEFFFSLAIDSKKSLCIGTITRKEAVSSTDENLGDGTGLYLFIAEQGAEISIIARVASLETATMFANLLRAGSLSSVGCPV